MAHTPSFSKKINESLLQVKRKQDDQLYCVDQKYDVLAPVRGILDQETAQQLVYLDFYHRIQANYYSLPVYIAPSYMSHHTMVHAFLQQYEADYQRVCSQLDRLAVLHTPYHLYHPCVIEALEQLDAKMFADHRAGVRADVVHYDIQTGRVAPDHHIQYIEEEQSQYIVRFFLNGSKDTLSGAIDYPYDVFGCVALLVNPHDKRYKKARGKEVILPITNRSVPVIPYEGVSIEGLGTRVLVPAHNREDFKIALEL